MLALCLASCEETPVPAIRESANQIGGTSDGQRRAKNGCFIGATYLVDGDAFTYTLH